MPEVTLAAANVKIEHNKARNLRRFLELIDEAASHGVDVLVLPEVGLQGYADFAPGPGSRLRSDQKQYYFREAEPIPGPSTEVIREAAERHGMYIQLGLAETALHRNVVYNSTALIGPQGVLGIYRKMHNQFEFPYFGPGEDAPTFATPHGLMASVICYDLLFPELLRTYGLNGADVVLMSTAWPMQGHERANDYLGWQMDTAAQANALFNQFWLVVSNHCEKGVYSEGLDYYGGSQIVDPYGKVVQYLADEEGLVIHTANLVQVAQEARTSDLSGMNLLQDRRPEHYGALVDESYRHPGQAMPQGGSPSIENDALARRAARPARSSVRHAS